jgi:type IV secretory pathway VirB6-like protein
VRYIEPQCETRGRVWINATQYFDGVPKEVWEFHVGGYQVCAKWLKDRKGRKLTYDDLTHYQQIVSALAETIVLMENIDAAITASGGWPIAVGYEGGNMDIRKINFFIFCFKHQRSHNPDFLYKFLGKNK